MPAQLGGENLGDERREGGRVTAVGKVDHRAVLNDDSIDEVQIAGDATQLIQDPSRDE